MYACICMYVCNYVLYNYVRVCSLYVCIYVYIYIGIMYHVYICVACNLFCYVLDDDNLLGTLNVGFN